MVFPPLPPRLRFLIHETVTKFYNETLSTVSIGLDKKRRTVIYLKLFDEKQIMSENLNTPSDNTTILESKVKEKKKKYPDKPLYQPPRSKSAPKLLNNSSTTNDTSHGKKSPDDNDLTWESLYDDNGDIIANDLNNQLEIDIKPENICRSKLDYTKFFDKTASSPDNGELNHILEIYGISPDLKTSDLSSYLSLK